MAQRIIDPEVIELAQAFKAALLAQKYQVDLLILFGSHASGRSKPWSDIDICVVSPDVTGLSMDDFPKLRQISEPISLDIEPHGLTPKQYASLENPFAHEVKRTGYVI